MSGMSKDELETYHEACQRFLERRGALTLSTLTPQGWPDISTAPFVRDTRNRFYIYISALASHTANLHQNPDCSIMLIADEQEARNLFARERMILRCKAKPVAPEDERYSLMLDQLEQKHGNTVQMLRTLPDFTLIELSPQEGSYVVGFGKAFELQLPDMTLIHRSADRLKG